MGAKRPPTEADRDHSEDELVDAPLQEEIELVGTLVAAVKPQDQSLSEPEIDRLLGVAGRSAETPPEDPAQP